MANQNEPSQFRTSVGGQALMEGIMMRGPELIACAVRRPDGSIDLSTEPVRTHWYNKVPMLRGICNMVENLRCGYKYLMHSADISMTEEEAEAEQSALDRWLEAHVGPKVQDILLGVSAALGAVMAVVLFVFLPTFLTGLLSQAVTLGRWPKVLIEAAIKLALFLGYMALCSRMKEIRRMFQYHGAEHKTIACYEAGEPLTVENIRKHTRFHPRCGTSFLIFKVTLSIRWPPFNISEFLRGSKFAPHVRLFLPSFARRAFCRGASILPVFPQPHFALAEGARNIDDALVGRAAEAQLQILQILDEFAVDEDVEHGEHLVRRLAMGAASLLQIAVEGIAGIAPDVLLRIALAEFPEERQQRALVLRLERFAAEKG